MNKNKIEDEQRLFIRKVLNVMGEKRITKGLFIPVSNLEINLPPLMPGQSYSDLADSYTSDGMPCVYRKFPDGDDLYFKKVW